MRAMGLGQVPRPLFMRYFRPSDEHKQTAGIVQALAALEMINEKTDVHKLIEHVDKR